MANVLGTIVTTTDLDSLYPLKSLYDAQTILAATLDNTPVALTVSEQTLVGRKTGGNIAALSGADVRSIAGVTVYDTETAQDAIGAMVGASLIYTDATPLLSRAALTGDVTAAENSNATTAVSASTTWAFTGDITPAQLTADVNDYNPAGLSTASVLRLSSDATERKITGIAGGADGRVLTLINVGANTIYLSSESASSTAANRISVAGGGSGYYYIPAIASIQIIYDSTASRWRILSSVTYPSANGAPIAAPAGGAIGNGMQFAFVDHIHAFARWISIGATLLNNTVAAGATVYAPPFYSGAPSSTQFTFTVVDQTTFGRLYCRISNAQPAGGTLVVSLRNTSAGTDIITLTIPAGSAAGTYSEVSTFPAAVAAGVQITFKIVNNAGAAASAQIMNTSVGMVPV